MMGAHRHPTLLSRVYCTDTATHRHRPGPRGGTARLQIPAANTACGTFFACDPSGRSAEYLLSEQFVGASNPLCGFGILTETSILLSLVMHSFNCFLLRRWAFAKHGLVWVSHRISLSILQALYEALVEELHNHLYLKWNTVERSGPGYAHDEGASARSTLRCHAQGPHVVCPVLVDAPRLLNSLNALVPRFVPNPCMARSIILCSVAAPHAPTVADL